MIGGHDLKDLNLTDVRRSIGYVGQEPVMFNDTIRKNMQLGIHQEMSEEELITALKKANAWEFIEKHEDQLDLRLGNAGG